MMVNRMILGIYSWGLRKSFAAFEDCAAIPMDFGAAIIFGQKNG